MRRLDIDEKKDEIIKRLEAGEPRATICEWLDCKYDTLKNRLSSWGYDHLKNPGRKGLSHPEAIKPVEHYLENDTKVSSHTLKLKLFSSGLKLKICEVCERQEWNGKPIPLELDHMDGNHSNNKLENLRILCPNCHAQTPTYKINNRKSTKLRRAKVLNAPL